MRIIKNLTILLAAAFMGSSVAWGGLITLSASNVIGGSVTGSGTWDGTNWGGIYNATHIFDIPTGPVSKDSLYWRCSGCGGAFITIDLGAAYQLTSVELFNTYFAGIYLGIKNFDLVAGNSVVYDSATSGDRLTGATTTILHGALTDYDPVTNPFTDPVTGQTLSVSDTGSYRYLELQPKPPGPPNAQAYGLYQMRLFGGQGSAVPEPASFGLIGLGLTACLVARRRAL